MTDREMADSCYDRLPGAAEDRRTSEAAARRRELARALGVVEKYFDVNLKTRADVLDLLVDNGVFGEVAEEVAAGIFPDEEEGSIG